MSSSLFLYWQHMCQASPEPGFALNIPQDIRDTDWLHSLKEGIVDQRCSAFCWQVPAGARAIFHDYIAIISLINMARHVFERAFQSMLFLL